MGISGLPIRLEGCFESLGLGRTFLLPFVRSIHRIKLVLDIVVGSILHNLGHGRPFLPEHFMIVPNHGFLFLGPSSLFNVGAQVVEVSFAALLAGPACMGLIVD